MCRVFCFIDSGQFTIFACITCNFSQTEQLFVHVVCRRMVTPLICLISVLSVVSVSRHGFFHQLACIIYCSRLLVCISILSLLYLCTSVQSIHAVQVQVSVLLLNWQISQDTKPDANPFCSQFRPFNTQYCCKDKPVFHALFVSFWCRSTFRNFSCTCYLLLAWLFLLYAKIKVQNLAIFYSTVPGAWQKNSLPFLLWKSQVVGVICHV